LGHGRFARAVWYGTNTDFACCHSAFLNPFQHIDKIQEQKLEKINQQKLELEASANLNSWSTTDRWDMEQTHTLVFVDSVFDDDFKQFSRLRPGKWHYAIKAIQALCPDFPWNKTQVITCALLVWSLCICGLPDMRF
jgi:hypothetical protein